jgi:asparagine N-glycosylation enzyme membrane subunit Stt3
MKAFLSKYTIEVLVLVLIFAVMSVPYFILNSGVVSSEEKLRNIENTTKALTPVIIGTLCLIIVYRAVKRNREER